MWAVVECCRFDVLRTHCGGSAGAQGRGCVSRRRGGFGGVLVFENRLKQTCIHVRYILNINNNSYFWTCVLVDSSLLGPRICWQLTKKPLNVTDFYESQVDLKASMSAIYLVSGVPIRWRGELPGHPRRNSYVGAILCST